MLVIVLQVFVSMLLLSASSTVYGQRCNITVAHKSKTYFQLQLISREPDFVQFSLKFGASPTIRLNFTDDVFQAKRWFWTYDSTSGPYPFLSWDLDYGILSFHLLEAKTINVPYIGLELAGNCSLTFGEQNATQTIATALQSLVDSTKKDNYTKYPTSYFCYLLTRMDYFKTLRYWTAIYFNYPINFVYYKCCTVSFDFDTGNFVTECGDKERIISGLRKKTITKMLPYVLGIFILLYFPVTFLSISAWLAKDEKIQNGVVMYELANDRECLEYLDENWHFSNGNSPLTLGELLRFKTLGLGKHPVLVSRLRRLLFVLSFPVFIYLQIAMYSEGMGLWNRDKIKVKDLVKVGCPMGFLSILGDAKDRRRVFVPLLGGPIGVVTIYYVLSVLFIALPRSVKQVIEDGLPSTNLIVNSPLFFGTKEVISMSRINVRPYHLTPGYTKAVTLLKCRFYMLFYGTFWKALWNIQTERILVFIRPENAQCCTSVIVCFFLPLYVLLCVVEIAGCIVFHGIPFCSFVSIAVNGGLKSLRYLRGQSVFLRAVFKYRITSFFGVSFVFTLFMIYIYVISLAFIISFCFISQVVTFCFVAIFMYPSVSFGYLFFFIVLLFYFIKLVRSFGDGYLELLASTVDMSRHLSEDSGQSFVSFRIRERDSTYGIPKKLFDSVVKKLRPVHQQVLILFFKAAIMIVFVILTLTVSANYVTGPSSEISEVMHVIFIVAVGTVPQLVQAVLSRSDTVLAREIEERRIKRLLVELWESDAYNAT